MECPFVDRSVAEEAEAHLVGLSQADAVGHARRHGQVTPDDPVAAEVAARHVVEMHAAALAPADASGLAAQLGEQGARIGPTRQGVAMVAVGRDEVVVGAQQAHGPHTDGLLADVEVQEAADLPFDVELRAALLEASDEEHRTVEG